MPSLPAADAADVAQLRAEIGRLQRELELQTRFNQIKDEAVQEYVGNLAHDLKNPLATIKMGVQGFRRALERGAVTPAEAQERLARIDGAVEHIKELIARARARVSERTAAQTPVQLEPVDLVALAREVADRFQQQAGMHRLEVQCSHSLLVAQLDPARFGRALEAVIDNALKFSPGDKPVTLTIERERDGDGVAISCRDEGIGIPARDLPYVGERFYRAENVLGRYKGAGMGLCEAFAVVSAHQGQVSIESVEGAGSAVTIRLPIT